MIENVFNKLSDWWSNLTKKQRGIIYITINCILIVALLIVLVIVIMWEPRDKKVKSEDLVVKPVEQAEQVVSNNETEEESELKDVDSLGEEIKTVKAIHITADKSSSCQHKWFMAGVPTEPTCEEKGIISVKCSMCDSEGYIEKDKLNHTYDDSTYKIIVKATCNSKGRAEYVCNRCGKTIEQDIEAGEHQFSTEYRIDLQPTCSRDGEKSRYCTVCGERCDITKIPALQHELATEIVQPTCTKDGLTTVKCKNCNFVQNQTVKAFGHKFGDKVVDKEATCTTAGEKSRHCSICQEKSEKEEIPALGHDWGNLERTEPTCTTDGSEVKTCKRCGEKETVILKATGHDWEQIDGKYKCKKCQLEVETLP